MAWRFFGNVKLTGSFPDVDADVEENSGLCAPSNIGATGLPVVMFFGWVAGYPKTLRLWPLAVVFSVWPEKPGEVGLVPTFFVIGD